MRFRRALGYAGAILALLGLAVISATSERISTSLPEQRDLRWIK
jgi:hypothetical protein